MHHAVKRVAEYIHACEISELVDFFTKPSLVLASHLKSLQIDKKSVFLYGIVRLYASKNEQRLRVDADEN